MECVCGMTDISSNSIVSDDIGALSPPFASGCSRLGQLRGDIELSEETVEASASWKWGTEHTGLKSGEADRRLDGTSGGHPVFYIRDREGPRWLNSTTANHRRIEDVGCRSLVPSRYLFKANFPWPW